MSIPIQKLAEYFEKLPGIGPRQAKRFVYSLLLKDEPFLNGLSDAILGLKKNTAKCAECRRYFEKRNDDDVRCPICSDIGREKEFLLVIEKDVDMENIEKSGSYRGYYFILGGLVPAIGSEMPKEIMMKELFEKTKSSAKNGLKEIILAFAATLEGENTCRYIEKILEPIIQAAGIKISRFGRGLSTGTEIEYADTDTIKNAVERRT
ncbi:MAG: toprim domain-containing protein [Candidatus Pacebacteria bacterium]|nr:toprim domain-containing protein [Candidatus Paceibacterota bacterium]